MIDKGKAVRFLRSSALCAAASGLVAVSAQAQDAVSRPVVQAVPRGGTDDLSEALRRLSSNPRDLKALLQAGRASLRLGDVEAAEGFFAKAQQLGSKGEGTAGLAAVQVYRKRPVEALQMFAQAEREGASAADFASDYGLACDLVGDNARAQQYYRMALSQGPDEEVTRRLALSYAIAGDRAASEKTLLPQLEKRDLAAYRTRAFALAVLGSTEEAESIVDVVMPESLAGRISPYLRYMPRLTRAQQAAAGNFGHFPEASDIGRDDPRIAQLSSAAKSPASAPAATPGGADARLVPAGKPLGPAKSAETASTAASDPQRAAKTASAAPAPAKSQSRSQSRSQPREQVMGVIPSEPARAPQAEAQSQAMGVLPASAAPASQAPAPIPAPIPAQAQQSADGELPPVSSGTTQQPVMAQSDGELPPLSAGAAAQAPGQSATAQTGGELPPARSSAPAQPRLSQAAASVTAPPATAPSSAPASSGAGFNLSQMPGSSAASAPPPSIAEPARTASLAPQPSTPASPAPAADEPPPPPPATLSQAFADFGKPQSTARPAPGAVDITKIKPKLEPKPKPAPPPKPVIPSRVWVQVATGKDRSALGFDWRRISRKADKLLSGKDAYLADWGQTTRLLTGPFKNEKEAMAMVNDLKQAGVDAFTFTSDEGEEVDPLPGRK